MKRVLKIFILGFLSTCFLVTAVSCGPIFESRIDKIGINSIVLNKEMKVEIYVPKGYTDKEEFPVLYLLHGYTGNESDMRKSGFFVMADILTKQDLIKPIIIVCPQIDNSYGFNSSNEAYIFGSDPERNMNVGKYEDYITEELVNYIDSTYNTIDDREGRFIGGVSMGGHTSLRLGFVHSDLYSKVGGHMPALWTDNFKDEGFENWLYPNENARAERDPLYIAENKNLTSLSMYLDCGEDDSYGFYDGCKILNETLLKQGCDVQWYLNEGGHTHEYIEENARKYLQFYAGTDD